MALPSRLLPRRWRESHCHSVFSAQPGKEQDGHARCIFKEQDEEQDGVRRFSKEQDGEQHGFGSTLRNKTIGSRTTIWWLPQNARKWLPQFARSQAQRSVPAISRWQSSQADNRSAGALSNATAEKAANDTEVGAANKQKRRPGRIQALLCAVKTRHLRRLAWAGIADPFYRGDLEMFVISDTLGPVARSARTCASPITGGPPVRLFRALTTLALWAWCGSWPDAVGAAPPTSDGLVRLAPVVSSADKLTRRIRVVSRMVHEDFGPLFFAAMYQAPDRCFLCVADGFDGIPILYLSERNLFMYEPVEGVALHCSATSFAYSICLTGEGGSNGWYVLHPSDRSSILVDVRSFYDRSATGDEVLPLGGAQISPDANVGRQRNIRSGILDLSRRCPYTRFEVSKVGAEASMIDVRDLGVDEDVDGPWPAFPSRQRLSAKFTVKDLTEGIRSDEFAARFAVYKCLWCRFALRQHRLRPDYEREVGAKVDWGEVERRYNSMSGPCGASWYVHKCAAAREAIVVRAPKN